MSDRKPLPEKRRDASRLKEGMEVRDLDDGQWYPITNILRMYKPMNIVRLSFADGTHSVHAPKDRVMSR